MTSALSEIAENDVYTTENYLFSQKCNIFGIFGIFAFSKKRKYRKYRKWRKWIFKIYQNCKNAHRMPRKWPLHPSNSNIQDLKLPKINSKLLLMKQKLPKMARNGLYTTPNATKRPKIAENGFYNTKHITESALTLPKKAFTPLKMTFLAQMKHFRHFRYFKHRK